jgi:hypothetical protein
LDGVNCKIALDVILTSNQQSIHVNMDAIATLGALRQQLANHVRIPQQQMVR